jgi:hypothetical protein
MKAEWWRRLFYRMRKKQEEVKHVSLPDIPEAQHILQNLQRDIERAYEEARLDGETMDACRHLLFRLDLLLPYAAVTSAELQERILRLIAEDAPNIVRPYLRLSETSQWNTRRELLTSLSYMAAEAKRIIQAIQEYERQAFTNQTSFIAKWYEKVDTMGGSGAN